MKKDTKKGTTEIVPTENKEIIPQENSIVNFNVESLMAKAIENGLSPETMEKFLAMRSQLKAEWAKEQFNKAMAGFQSECPTIVKEKEVKNDSGKVLYRYAPIESVISQVKETLQKYGFSYSTSMEVLQEGVKVCVKTIHIDGHSEESCMQVPLGTKTGIMSASQQVAAAQTFAKRYAFLNAFGIMTGDEDNDGAEIQKPSQPAQTATQRILNTPPVNVLSENGRQWIKNLVDCKDAKVFDTLTKQMNVEHNEGRLSEYDWKEIKAQHLKTMTALTKPVVTSPAEKAFARAKEMKEEKANNPAEIVEAHIVK